MDEIDILGQISKYVDEKKQNMLQNDDVVAFRVGKNYMLVNIDGWVESTDRPNGMTPYAMGYRACCNALSDIYAKGGDPRDMVVSLSIPQDRSEEIVEIVKAVADVAREYNVNYLGGDLNECQDVVIDVCVFGYADRLISRGGAKLGDWVYWLGPDLGQNLTAINILQKEWKGDRDVALEIISYPKLFPEFVGLSKYEINASIDCSDGLVASLYSIIDSSNVGIMIDYLPTDDWAEQVYLRNKREFEEAVLYGGEELGIIFTSPIELEGATRIGKVISDQKLIYMNKEVTRGGWKHFQIEK